MTPKATLTQSGSQEKLSNSSGLANAIELHCAKEKASFHTPGHKGGANFRCGQNLWALDVTELPGLDELAYADGVLANVQRRAAELWQAQASFISTNGASAAVMAAILACASRGTSILLPRNVHRSAINALVMTGLEPIWYEPFIDQSWDTWAGVDVHAFTEAVRDHSSRLAAAVVVSPTYSGSVSDVQQLSALCRKANVPLIVDEAHGAHFGFADSLPPHAVTCGADIVIHSLHKTLSAMTQTGVIHVGKTSLVEPDAVRLALNMLQSSSPNYVLMTSVESCLNEVQSRAYITRATDLALAARVQLSSEKAIHLYSVENVDPLHIVLRVDGLNAEKLFARLAEHGIFAETVIGQGVLFLFGCGTTKSDVDLLVGVLQEIASAESLGTKPDPSMSQNVECPHSSTVQLRTNTDQVLSPRQAFLARTESIPIADAIGRIAAECVAPCPPGSPVVVPGQRITAAALEFCKLPNLRVVLESQQGEH